MRTGWRISVLTAPSWGTMRTAIRTIQSPIKSPSAAIPVAARPRSQGCATQFHWSPLVPGLIACSVVFRGRAWQPDRGRHHAAARTSQPWRRTRLHLDRASGLVESVSGRQGPADLAEGALSQDQPHGSLPPARLCGAHQASDCREIFAWISRCRRLARDDEHHVRKAAAFVRRAMIRLMLRRAAASQWSRAQTSRIGSESRGRFAARAHAALRRSA